MFEKKVLYAITDEYLLKEDFEKKVEEALKSGVDIIQYRAKKKNAKDMIEEAIVLKKLCIKYGVPLIINDRVDIALAVDADGVHVGQEDIPVLYVRNLIGNKKILGLSTKNLKHVEEANKLPVDYIGFGSIFPTNTKEDAKVAGLKQLEEAVNISLQPIIAIGGINESNIDEVLKTGCSGVAIVSAIFAGKNIKENVKNLKARIKKY